MGSLPARRNRSSVFRISSAARGVIGCRSLTRMATNPSHASRSTHDGGSGKAACGCFFFCSCFCCFWLGGLCVVGFGHKVVGFAANPRLSVTGDFVSLVTACRGFGVMTYLLCRPFDRSAVRCPDASSAAIARCTDRPVRHVRVAIVEMDGQHSPWSLALSAREISTAFAVGGRTSGQQADMTTVLTARSSNRPQDGVSA